MHTSARNPLTTTTLCVAALMAAATALAAEPTNTKDIAYYCAQKGGNALLSCLKAGMSSDYCYDIALRTQANCIQRLSGTRTGGAPAQAINTPTTTSAPTTKSLAVTPPTTTVDLRWKGPPSTAPAPTTKSFAVTLPTTTVDLRWRGSPAAVQTPTTNPIVVYHASSTAATISGTSSVTGKMSSLSVAGSGKAPTIASTVTAVAPYKKH